MLVREENELWLKWIWELNKGSLKPFKLYLNTSLQESWMGFWGRISNLRVIAAKNCCFPCGFRLEHGFPQLYCEQEHEPIFRKQHFVVKSYIWHTSTHLWAKNTHCSPVCLWMKSCLGLQCLSIVWFLTSPSHPPPHYFYYYILKYFFLVKNCLLGFSACGCLHTGPYTTYTTVRGGFIWIFLWQFFCLSSGQR